MDEVAGGGVPDLQRQIVGRCDHRAVVAVPRYHGNFQLRHLVLQGRGVVLSTRERERKNIFINVKGKCTGEVRRRQCIGVDHVCTVVIVFGVKISTPVSTNS